MSTVIWIISILIIWPLTLISWIKKHSKKLISVSILFYTVASTYTLFSELSFFRAYFYTLDRDVRLSLIYFSFFSLATCAIYLTKGNGTETIDNMPLTYVASNDIYFLLFFIAGFIALFSIQTIIISILSFGSAVLLIYNRRTNGRGVASPHLFVSAGFACFIISFFLLQFSSMFNNFFGSVIYSFAILFLFLSAIKCIDFFRLAWAASAIWLVGIAIFMFSVAMPQMLITDQMRLSSDGRFSYRIEIVERGRNSEHVRLFARELETERESVIILPELFGSLVMEDGEKFGDFVLWEDDKYILLLDPRMWIDDTNWLALNEIDMSTESAQPFSPIDIELFWLLQDLWIEGGCGVELALMVIQVLQE